MACELNQGAWEKVIDEDLAYLLKQPRTLEREHIADCLKWLRVHKPTSPPTDECSGNPVPGKPHRWAGPHEIARGFTGCIWCGAKKPVGETTLKESEATSE